MAGRCAHAYTSSPATSTAPPSPAAHRRGVPRSSVDWDVTWTATNGQSGRFATITKATTFDRAVTEVQVLVTG